MEHERKRILEHEESSDKSLKITATVK